MMWKSESLNLLERKAAKREEKAHVFSKESKLQSRSDCEALREYFPRWNWHRTNVYSNHLHQTTSVEK